MNFKFTLLLVFVLALISCENSTKSPSVVDNGTLLNDQSFSTDEEGEYLANWMVNGMNENSEGNERWFCSLFRGEQYYSRTTLAIYENGVATFGSRTYEWSELDSSTISLKAQNTELIINDINFKTSRFLNDQFESRLDGGSSLVCDWSGTPRSGSVMLNDSSSQNSYDEERDSTGIERLLITALDGNRNFAMWQCDITDELGGTDTIDYQFYAASRGEAVQAFEWAEIDENSISIFYPTASYRLDNITFTDDELKQFIADDSRGYKTSCSWFGPSRVDG